MKARLEPTRIEVPRKNGRKPCTYVWVPAVFVIKEDGSRIYPPMRIQEARRYCREEGIQIEVADENS